ncbi:MAG: hypothetical protein ACREEC_01670 [Thermoplasmata archaeon]
MARGKKSTLPKEIVPLPIHCSGSGCGEETALLLPGKLPYRQGIWMEEGWQVFNHLENRSVLFLCDKCREKGLRSGEVASTNVPVTIRD